jgi:hypothetical protein
MSLMQRMSDMLTRWFDDNNRRQSASQDPDEAPSGDNPAEEGNEAATTRQDAGSNEGGETEAVPPSSADSTGDYAGTSSSLPSLRLPVAQGIPESSSSSDSLSSPSTVIAITPCIEKRLVTVDEDIAEEQSQQDISTSDNTESTPVNTVSENITSDSGSSDLKEDSVLNNGALPNDQTSNTPSIDQTKLILSPSCEEAASSSTLEVLETISNEVSSIRERIITLDVEPVISLEYSCEGTTASTIKVGFTPSEGVIDIDSEPMQSSGNSSVSALSLHDAKTDESEPSSIHSDKSVSQPGASSMEIASASDFPSLVPKMSTHSIVTQENNTDIVMDTQTASEGLKSEEPELGPWETVSAFDMKLGPENSSKPESSITGDEISEDKSYESSDDPTRANEIIKDLDSPVKDSNSSGLIQHSLVSTDAKAAEIYSEKSLVSASEQGDASPMEQRSDVTTSEYLSAMDTDGSRESSIGGDPPNSADRMLDEGRKVGDGAVAEKNDGCDMVVDSIDTEKDGAAKTVTSDSQEGAPSAEVEGAGEDEDDPTAGG